MVATLSPLGKIARLCSGGPGRTLEDKETLEKLASSFEEELITLKGTVDGLDARVSELEENSQFSTTTKAEFKIATDFVYFSAEEEEARGMKTEKTMENVMVEISPEQNITIGGQTVTVTSAEVTVNPFTTVIGSQMIALPQQVVRDEIGPMTIGLKDSMFQNTNSADFAAGGKYSDFVTADTSKYMLIGVDDNNEIVVDDSSGILIDTDVATIAPTDNLVLVERPIDPATNARYTNGALTGTTDATTETAMTLLNLLNENRVMTEAVDAIIVNPSTVDIPMRTITIGDNMFDIMKQSDKAVNANNEVMIDEIMIPVSGSSTPVTISSNTVTIDSDPVNYPSISVNLMSGKATIGAREFTTGTGTYSISAIEITGNPEQIVVGEQTFIVEDEMVTVTDPMVTVEGLKYTVPDFTITEIDADGNATTNVATITGYTITENPSTMITEDNLTVTEVGPIDVKRYAVEVDGQTISIAPQTLTVEGQTVTIPPYEVVIPAQTIPADMGYQYQEVETSVPYGEDNSGLALSSSVEIAFETSFSGSDKLTFKLKGDVLSMENHYLALGNVYDVADNGHTNVEFTGFSYENNLDLGGMMANLIFGTDVDDLDPIVGLDTYYGGGGYDGYGANDFGDAGLGFNVELLSSDAGTVTASASYAVDGAHASDQTGEMGLFGEETDRSFAVGLNWEGALLGGNDARFTVAYQNIHENNMDDVMGHDRTKSIFHLVAGAHFTDSISLSGSYSFGEWDYDMTKDRDAAHRDAAQWLVALNMDDAIFPGNSAGIAYGTPEYVKDAPSYMGMDVDPITVLELYYSFKVNDNFTVPVYLDFFSNAGNPMMGNGTDSNAFGFIIRPTLSF